MVRDLETVLAGLNDLQREAALVSRGPVAILAGAGTGKTTTITHRIACQVRSGAFDASQILAVTFTDKAAGELRRRLQALGVHGVDARTFHSAALSQLSRLWSLHNGEPLAEVLDHKAPLIASLANALPPPHKFLPRRELANEIEWARSEEHTSELQSHSDLVCRLLLEKKKHRTGASVRGEGRALLCLDDADLETAEADDGPGVVQGKIHAGSGRAGSVLISRSQQRQAA